MTEQPTLQDCIDELEKLKPELTIIHAERVTKTQKMIQSVSETVLNRNCYFDFGESVWKEESKT